MPTYWVLGHADLTPDEFALHYLHHLEAAGADPDARFVVGDAEGADTLARAWLAHRKATVRGHARSPVPIPDRVIAWVRPGRGSSDTAARLRQHAGHRRATVGGIGPSDWRRLRSVRLTALAEAPGAFGSTWAREHAQPDAFWTERLSRPEVKHLIARTDRDVGLCVVAPAPGGGLREAALYGVWVAPGARRGGVGRALTAAATATARQAGFRRLLLEVADDNTAAIRLYAAMGFVATGRVCTMDPPRDHVTEHERALVL